MSTPWKQQSKQASAACLEHALVSGPPDEVLPDDDEVLPDDDEVLPDDDEVLPLELDVELLLPPLELELVFWF